jgi:FO synthase
MMFGHVDAPPHWVGHMRRLADLQRETGGFTEFVPLPFVHRNAPIYLAGRARPGPSLEDSLRVHAVARIVFDGLIDNVQVSWVKLGVAACQRILRAGANDFGGTLMEETISRMAGAEWGIEMTAERFDDAIRAIGRVPAVRTTTYDRVAFRDGFAASGALGTRSA